MTGETTLSVRGVAFRIEGRCLLGPVTLGFAPGLVHAVIGHNGSGKSTLLKLMARQLRPAAGSADTARPAYRLGGRGEDALLDAARLRRQPRAMGQETPLTIGFARSTAAATSW